MNMRLVVALGLFVTLASMVVSDAATYAVGKDGVWTFPSTEDEYSIWASSINFTIGDVLVFDFPTGAHDVATVTKANYDSCVIDNPLARATIGPASITLTTSGMNYFICTVAAGDHCKNDLKVAVNVSNESSGTTSPPPTPSPAPSWRWNPSPVPSPSYTSSSSATSVLVAGWCSLLVGLVAKVMVMA